MPHPVAQLFELLACPKCSSSLGELSCPSCGAQYDAPSGIPRLRGALDPRTEAVRRFYEASPFPGYARGENLSNLRARGKRNAFAQLLDEAIPGDARILEVGCGTGQMSLFLARADRLIVATDLSRPSLELGADAARRFGVDRILFVETDLGTPGLRAAAFDVVYCSGVLHHTPDPRKSFTALARLVRPGGFVVVGLYHSFARLPHRLRRGLARLTRFRWIALDPVLRERELQPARREAWLRDQYHHPEEHRHTLGQVKHWFRENGIDYLRSYPTALVGSAEPTAAALFTRAEDDWWLESVFAQASWIAKLSHEGGLFVVIGSRTDGAPGLGAQREK
jgi:ubiquinone/menaquinone biosynthesis C-methylase UbiE